MNQLTQGKPLTVFGDGSQTRTFTYVRDIASVIAQAPLNPRACGDVFNVGADKPYPVRELAERVRQAMEMRPEIQFLPVRKEVLHAHATHIKVRSLFECPTETPLDEGLRRRLTGPKGLGYEKVAYYTRDY